LICGSNHCNASGRKLSARLNPVRRCYEAQTTPKAHRIFDIALGVLLAGALAAWVPKRFWRLFFLAAHPQ
jgi:hypothetical protein